MIEVRLRDCGAVGHLGLLFILDKKGNDMEIYRTGRHYMMQYDCLHAVNEWKDYLEDTGKLPCS